MSACAFCPEDANRTCDLCTSQACADHARIIRDRDGSVDVVICCGCDGKVRSGLSAVRP